MFSSSSSLTTVSKLRLVIGHRVVPIGTSHLWLLRVRTPHSSASVHLPLLFGTRSGIVAAFCILIIQVKALGQVVQSLLRKGAFELAPLSSLGYYSRLFFILKALGSWWPVLSLDFVRKIHHPEGSVSAFSDASVFRIVSSVHGVRQSFSNSWLFAWVSPRLRRSSHESWLLFGVFSTVLDSASALFARLANSGVLLGVDFLSLKTFLWLCNSLGMVVDWEKSQLVEHQLLFLPRSPVGLCQFPGFSSAVTSRQASLNWLLVSIMSGSTCIS